MLKNRELAVKAQEVITESLKKRIPYVDVIPADSGSEYVLQSDIFGYVDSLIRLPGTRLYSNQNKSRHNHNSKNNNRNKSINNNSIFLIRLWKHQLNENNNFCWRNINNLLVL